MSLVKNQDIILTIANMGVNGEGVAKYGGMAVFVPYALIGEKVKAHVIFVKKRYAIAKLLEVLTPAEERVRPECPVFLQCGGCQLQHLKYCNQLKIKTSIVKDSLIKIAKIDVEVAPCVKSDFQYEYRNKLQLPVGDDNGLIITGFFAENTHRIVPIDSCPLHPEWAAKLINAVKDFMYASQIKGYNESDKSGIIRHIVARELAGQIMIILVINCDSLKCNYLIENLKKIFPYFSLYLNINKEDTNVITGEQYIHIYGEETLKDESMGIKYEIGADSFMQVNNYIKDRIYSKVTELIKCSDNPVCIDAYSGAGILSAMMAKCCKKVYGIEIVEEAVKNAESLKSANNLGDRLINIKGDCAVELPKLLDSLKDDNTVLILDPPRKGCDEPVIRSILKHLPKKIIYISCNPATLARDLGYITGTLDIDGAENFPNPENSNNLYEITLVQPYDMFPQTKHVETVVLLSRVKE